MNPTKVVGLETVLSPQAFWSSGRDRCGAAKRSASLCMARTRETGSASDYTQSRCVDVSILNPASRGLTETGSRMFTACAARRWGFMRFVTTMDALRSPIAGGVAVLVRLRSISTLVAVMNIPALKAS
jgi:hypothetical protein